jgi:Putative amidoligase enzyme
MNASDLTFGIEIETIAPDSAVRDDGLRIGSYKHGIQVPYLPAGWTAEADGSINNGNGGHKCEIVSPVLRGAEGLAQVVEVLRTLDAKGHKVNASCGVHVHVGWKREWSSDALARLVTIVAYVEKGLYAITGSKLRERGMYCGGVRKYGDEKRAKDQLEQARYHALNLTNLARGTKDTVEFRVFSGTLKAVKVVGWVQVCLGLVERALVGKRMPSWSPKPLSGGWKKKGEGASEAERLMGYLAWGAGYARIHGGRQFGWLGDAIPQTEIKKEFRRLAKKYDAHA